MRGGEVSVTGTLQRATPLGRCSRVRTLPNDYPAPLVAHPHRERRTHAAVERISCAHNVRCSPIAELTRRGRRGGEQIGQPAFKIRKANRVSRRLLRPLLAGLIQFIPPLSFSSRLNYHFFLF